MSCCSFLKTIIAISNPILFSRQLLQFCQNMACSGSQNVIGIETSNNGFIIAQLFLFFTLSAAAVNSKTFFTSTQNDLTPLYNCIILKQTFVFCKLPRRLKNILPLGAVAAVICYTYTCMCACTFVVCWVKRNKGRKKSIVSDL